MNAKAKETTGEIIDHEPQQGRQIAALTPMDMIDRAVASGANVETLGKLMELQERWDKNQARKAFDNAMAAAKAELPVIFKNREVDFTSQKGRTNYRHEDLAGIAKQVDPVLAKHGLSYRYRTATEANMVTVTCIVSHRDGHSEENSLSCPHDMSGNKNPIQAQGSAITYLQRYSLKAALGLAASNDDDGKAADQGGVVSDEQAAKIMTLITETKTNIDRFLKWAGAPSISDIPAARFNDAVAMLNAKKTQKQEVKS
jgi:hypothetical protein